MNLCMGCMSQLDEHENKCPHCGYVRGTSVKEAYYLLPESILHKKYIVGKVLGYGGFGVTYLGWDAQLERKVAIKEYLPSDFSTRTLGDAKLTVFSGDAKIQFADGLKSFIEESQRLAKMNQVSEIVDIYDCFMENETGYIIMQFLDGMTVKEMIAKGNTFSFEEAKEIIETVLNGLEAAHKEGIIHRDVAPDNIFICSDGTVKLIDFGAARYAASSHSKSLSVILKPGYAPEEQYRSKGNQGPWTDVYGAAATMYRMLTGIRPDESIERLVDDKLQPPSSLGIVIPTGAENALLNALNVKAENRIQSAEEFREQLNSDEVERVEVVEEKVDASRFPQKVKIAIGVFSVVVLVGILLAVSGVMTAPAKQMDQSGKTNALKEGELYVPDVTGMTYNQANKLLSEKQIKVVKSGMNYSTKVKKNKILSQNPKDGQIISKDGTVKLIMSGGIESVTMVDLENEKKSDAVEALEARGLVFDEKKSSETYSDLVEKGRVISQSVAADKILSPGTKVSLEISKGKLSEETAVLEVPYLVGMTKAQAQKALEDLKQKTGFTYTIGEINKENSVTIPKGQITAQSLEPGKKVRTDTILNLAISLGPKEVEMPNILYATEADARKALEALNLVVAVDNQYSSEVESGHVISQSINEKEKTFEGTTITLAVSLGPQPVYSTPSSSSSSNGSGYDNSGSSGSSYYDSGSSGGGYYDSGSSGGSYYDSGSSSGGDSSGGGSSDSGEWIGGGDDDGSGWIGGGEE